MIKRDDVESLHQMRVAMRRLRSALSMFKRLLHLPEKMQRELDWLDQHLGPARDWDVLTGSTLPALARDILDRVQFDDIRQAAADTAHLHHVTAAAAVGSSRYSRLQLSLTRWVQGMAWQHDKATTNAAAKQLAQSVEKFAQNTLERDQRRLHARAANLQTASPEAHHRVRIAAKKTRYAAEFFESLLTPKTVRPYIKRLSGLQDELGVLNDAAVADRLLAELSAKLMQLEASASFVRGFLAARAQDDNKLIVKRWKRFAPIGLPRLRDKISRRNC